MKAGTPQPPFSTFEEFYLFYLSQHSHPTSRILHIVGTLGGALIFLLALMLRAPIIFFLALIFGYGCAWCGHFLFEKNRPATFRYPWWSFQADWKMTVEVLTGKRGLSD